MKIDAMEMVIKVKRKTNWPVIKLSEKIIGKQDKLNEKILLPNREKKVSLLLIDLKSNRNLNVQIQYYSFNK